MTKHYLPDPVVMFDIDEKGESKKNSLCPPKRLPTLCLPLCNARHKRVLSFAMFVSLVVGGTFLGFTVNRMPADRAGYIVDEYDQLTIYEPDSIYLLKPYVSMNVVDVSNRNVTKENQTCTVKIKNLRGFIQQHIKQIQCDNNSLENTYDSKVYDVIECYGNKNLSDESRSDLNVDSSSIHHNQTTDIMDVDANSDIRSNDHDASSTETPSETTFSVTDNTTTTTTTTTTATSEVTPSETPVQLTMLD